MTIQEIWDLALKMGIEADPRGEKAIKKLLENAKKEYKELSEKKKKYFDLESFTNPYSDSRVMFGDPKRQVKRVLAGIDADSSEILLADRLSEKGKKIDLVIGHHPIGMTLAALHEVMDIQVDVYAEVGVPVNVLEAQMNERAGLIMRRIHPANHNQIVDTAKLLEMPVMVLHTIWDNITDKFMKEHLAKKKLETVGEIYDHIMEMGEFQEASRGKNPPEIVSGSPKNRTGKIACFMTGGTNPSKETYMELAKAGVGTLVDMHIPEDALIELKKMHVNVINTGHMASDSIGANLFFDELEKKGVEVIPCSGLVRVRRNKK